MNHNLHSYSEVQVARAVTEDRKVQGDGRSTKPHAHLLSLPRQGRSREKLDRLLAAGAQLFGEQGFEGTRIGDVAELGGCSVGVFYQRFSHKDAFFAAVRSRWIAQALERVEERLDAIPVSTSAPQLLTLFVHEVVSLFRDHLGLIRAFLIYEADHPESSVPMLELARAIGDRLVGRVLEHEFAAGHSEPALAIRFGLEVLRATLVYLALRDTEGPLGLGDERLAPELVRMLAAYLGVGRAGMAQSTLGDER